MHHFGLICPPGTSHVTGLTTVARELCQRGHRATVFNILDVEELAHKEAVGFHPLGVAAHPKGFFRQFSDEFRQLHGLDALRFGLKAALGEITMLLEEAPDALRAAGVTTLIVDQGQPAGSTIAERLGLPFVTICNAVPSDPDPRVPPAVTPWGPATSWSDRARIWASYRFIDMAVSPIRRRINSYRTKWSLKPLRSLYETFSPILELAQETSEFDFPRQSPPRQFHYIGLIRRAGSLDIAFPFDRLDGRPLVYGSLGTVAGDTKGIFRMLADACAPLPVQLVISLGGTGDADQYADLPGDPIVVNYAPQLTILGRAAVTVCHAGNNTVLESMACGVPVVAVPLNTDQYGVAARLVQCGAGERISLGQLDAPRLRERIAKVLSQPSYAQRARAICESLDRAGGERRAADLIEQTLDLLSRTHRPDNLEYLRAR